MTITMLLVNTVEAAESRRASRRPHAAQRLNNFCMP